MPAVVVPVATWIAGTVSVAGAAVGITGSAGAWLAAATYTVSEIALYAGMSFAIDAVTRPEVKPAGSELNLNMDPAYPREMIIGERPVGGSLVARYSRDINNYFAHVVIQIADHPCVELSKVYDGGRLVHDAPLVHGVRTEITSYSNSGGPRLWMTYHDGRPGQTADMDLVTKSATDPEVVAGKIDGWTADHVGAGCAYVHVEIRWDPDILTSLPQFTFLMKGARLYDRRKDTTAGGSGSQRLDDPSTWEFSSNAMVAMDHYMLGYKVEDDPLAFGIGLTPIEVPYAQFAAAADLCDEDVATGEGDTAETIKRYAANGVISAGDYFQEVIEAFQIQMAARVVDLGGRIGILGAEERAITVSLTEDDLISGEPLQYADKLDFDDLIGSVTGTFADPANNYQPTPYDPVITAYNALPDGGEAQATSLPLPFEVHPRRAVRLVSAYAARETLQPRLAAVFSPKAWTLEPGDWFEFTSARLQVEAGKFEVVDIVKNDDFTVIITARAIDPNFLAFDNDNDPDLSVPPDVPPVSLLLDVPEFDVEVTTLESSDGVIEPALEVTLTSDETIAREVVYEYTVWDSEAEAGDEIVGPTLVDSVHVSQIVTKLRKGILPSTQYAVRAMVRSGRRESPWTDWSAPVTTGETYTVGEAASVPWSGVFGSGRPDDDADVTSANTAAAIAGQGALALLNIVALGASGRVYRDDGVTRLTDALAVTSLGTAAAFASQGALATLSTINSSSLMGANVVAYTALTVTAVRLGVNITRNDGSTSLTDALAVTSIGTAAAIASQGALATLSSVAPSNLSVVGDPSNMIADVDFSDSASWTLANGGTFDTTTETTNLPTDTPKGLGVVRSVKTDTGNGTTTQTSASRISQPVAARMQVVGGKAYRIAAQSLVKSGFCGQLRLRAFWYKGDKTTAASTTNGEVRGVDYRTTAAAADTQAQIAGMVTAPADAVWVSFAFYVQWPSVNNSAGYGLLGQPRMFRASELGTMVVREDGVTALTDALAVTSLGTAAAIVSQGALAILSQVALGASGRVYRDDGSTHLTDALAVTSLGTAAAFASQGALATLSTINSSSLMGSGVVAYTALTTTAVRLNVNIVREDGSTAVTDALAITSLGTASAIASQGALATLSQVALGASGRVYRDDGVTRLTDALAITSLGTASAIASQGALATLSSVALGASGRVYRDDGTTRLTDALAITALGTAAAIASQGALATLSSAAWGSQISGRPTNLAALSGSESVNNALVAMGPNALRQAEFRIAGYYYTQGTPTPADTYDSSSGLRRALLTSSGSVANGNAGQLTAASNNFLTGVQAGDRVEASAYLGATGWPKGRIQIYWYSWTGSAYAFISASDAQATTSLTGKDGSGDLSTFLRLGGFATAPATTVAAAIVCRFENDSGGALTSPVGRITKPLIRLADATQTALSPWAPGFEGEPGADVTASNTAAAIAGQGALALLSLVSLGASGRVYRDDGSTHLTDALAVTSLGTASAIASQGALATLSLVALGASGRVYRDDGSTHLTDALAVTSLGTAAAFASQGALATLSTINSSSLMGSGVVAYTALTTTAVRLATNIVREDGSTSVTDAIAITSLGTASAIASQGALATLGQVNLGASGRVYRDDGATRLTDALAVTSLGTASAIASQGALATLSTINSTSLMGSAVVAYTALTSTAVRLGTNITRADGSTSLTDALAVTSLGTASAISSQGALATLSQVALGASGLVYRDDGSTHLTDALAVTSLGTASAISSQGALATLSLVALGASGRVYRDDGSTHLTDALAVTSLGTASAIASQGALATLSTINSTSLMGANVVAYTALTTTAVRLATNIVREDGSTSVTDAIAITSLGTASAISSQGALATLSQVALGASGRVYRDDGSTHLTDALAVTSLGTASAISSQGALATLSTINSTSLMGSAVVAYTALTSTAARLGTNVTRNDGTTSLTDALAVTSLGTASAIASQGALATMSSVIAGYLGAGAVLPSNIGVLGDPSNMVQDPDFSDTAAWTLSNGASLDTSTDTTTTMGLTRSVKTDTGNGTTTQTAGVRAGPPAASYVQVEGGKSYRLAAKALVKSGFTGQLRLRAFWYKADKTTAASTANSEIQGTNYRSVAAGADAQQVISGLVNAPADAVWVRFAFYVQWSSVLNNAQYGYLGQPRMHRASELGTMLTREDGSTALTDALAVTSLGTASAIASQGALATLSLVAFGASGRVYRDDGTTRVTDALAITVLGTAAAISSQGNLATANYYYQSSDPGSVPNGSQWTDTTAQLHKLRHGGAWVTLFDVGQIRLTVSPGSAGSHGIGTGSRTTNSVTVTASGGDGSYTYEWEKVGVGTTMTVNSPSSATTSFSTTVAAGNTKNATYRCTVRDGANRVAFIDVPVSVTEDSV